MKKRKKETTSLNTLRVLEKQLRVQLAWPNAHAGNGRKSAANGIDGGAHIHRLEQLMQRNAAL